MNNDEKQKAYQKKIKERKALRLQLPHGAIKTIMQNVPCCRKTVNRFFRVPNKLHRVTEQRILNEVNEIIEAEAAKFTNVNTGNPIADKFGFKKPVEA